MKHRIFLLSILLIAMSAQAQESRMTLEEEIPPSTVHGLLAIGSELRPEKDIDSNFQQHTLTNYALGAGFDQYIFLFEKAEFRESSGNSSLKVNRLLEDYMLWAQFRSLRWNRLVPYLGAGVGAYKDTIETKLLSTSHSDESAEKMLVGLAFGMSADLPVLWLSIEVRVLFGDQLDQNPTLGGLTRIGLHF